MSRSDFVLSNTHFSDLDLGVMDVGALDLRMAFGFGCFEDTLDPDEGLARQTFDETDHAVRRPAFGVVIECLGFGVQDTLDSEHLMPKDDDAEVASEWPGQVDASPEVDFGAESEASNVVDVGRWICGLAMSVKPGAWLRGSADPTSLRQIGEARSDAVAMLGRVSIVSTQSVLVPRFMFRFFATDSLGSLGDTSGLGLTVVMPMTLGRGPARLARAAGTVRRRARCRCVDVPVGFERMMRLSVRPTGYVNPHTCGGPVVGRREYGSVDGDYKSSTCTPARGRGMPPRRGAGAG